MKTRLLLRTDAFFVEEHLIDQVPDGQGLADLMAAQLPKFGFPVKFVVAEDWGWHVELDNADFKLSIGCGIFGHFDNGFHCFIRPNRPQIRKWFRRISTEKTVERLGAAMMKIASSDSRISDVHWE
jgi:hypothetical protein